MDSFDLVKKAQDLAFTVAKTKIVGDESPYPYAFGYFTGLMGEVLLDLNLTPKQLDKVNAIIERNCEYENLN